MANDDRRMTVVEHLSELRRVLMISALAWLVPTVVLVAVPFLRNGMLDILEHPLRTVLPQTNHLIDAPIITKPTEGLTIPLKVAAACGFVVGLPVILWQVWTFVSPGLRPVERKFAVPFLGTSLALFALGAAFAYFVMPVGLNFLATFLGGNAVFFPDLNEYLSFFTLLIVIFGVTFELPVALVLLGVLGIVSSRWLRRRRRGIYVGIILAALVVTPGADPFTPTLLFLPLLGFFELAILVLDRVFHK